MTTLALLCLLLALGAAALLALYLLQRRQQQALRAMTQQLHHITVGNALSERVDTDIGVPEIQSLGQVVNHLLNRIEAQRHSETIPSTPPLTAQAPLGALGDHLHEVVLIHSESEILYANPQFAALVGIDKAELVGRRLADLVPPEYADLVGENILHRLSGVPSAERYEVDLVGLQGQQSRLELSSWPVEHDGIAALLIVGVEVLPTQTVQTLAHLDVRPARARQTLDSVGDAILTVDMRGRIDYLNPAAQRLLGIGAEAANGTELEAVSERIDEKDRKLFSEPVHQALTGAAPLHLGRRALVIKQPGDGERLVELSAAPMRDVTGDHIGAVITLHDVTEIRGLTRQISYQATHDALTGLVNRPEFERRLQDAIDSAHSGDGTHILCYLDLDRFKLINDTSGHLAGDSLLREVSKLLREQVRDSDTVARIGGDEFGLLLIGCPLDKARQIADDVCREVADFRFVWKDRLFNIGVSVGLVEVARDSGTLEEAMASADSACYVAKRQGGHVAVYSARDEIQARQSGEIQWLQLLQTALRDNTFELYCQPIIPAFGSGGDGPAMEVFVRLKDEAGQQVSTAEFLKAAERYRLTALIDRKIVQTALTALGRGAIALPPKRSIALNISGQTLADAQFLEFVVECLDSTGANPAQVCFEIAESAVIANLEQSRRFIGVLHGMGCRFALDNFGSGLGSFSSLKNLGVDYLKIDGSFMRNLDRDSVNQAMVAAMIQLARTLNFKVIGEQIEEPAALEAARSIGIDFLQGYAVGRPTLMRLAA
jgi:diguanylate cyclase (GGDEF)-like protein/PAS domain S-box-containing protein